MDRSEITSQNDNPLIESSNISGEVTRINFQYLISEIGNVLAFKKGIFFTVKELIIRPGQSVRIFLNEDRSYLVKPILFTFFCAFVYSIVQQQFGFEDGYYEEVYKEIDANSPSLQIVDWIRHNYGYANIIMGFFIVPWLKVFFRKYDYNFFELIVLWLYVSGLSMLIYLVFGIAESLTGWPLFLASAVISGVYTAWAIGLFYNKKNMLSYIKALICWLLGALLFNVFATIIGVTLDILYK